MNTQGSVNPFKNKSMHNFSKGEVVINQQQTTDEFLQDVKQSIDMLKDQNFNQNANLLEEYAQILEEIEMTYDAAMIEKIRWDEQNCLDSRYVRFFDKNHYLMQDNMYLNQNSMKDKNLNIDLFYKNRIEQNKEKYLENVQNKLHHKIKVINEKAREHTKKLIEAGTLVFNLKPDKELDKQIFEKQKQREQ